LPGGARNKDEGDCLPNHIEDWWDCHCEYTSARRRRSSIVYQKKNGSVSLDVQLNWLELWGSHSTYPPNWCGSCFAGVCCRHCLCRWLGQCSCQRACGEGEDAG